MEKTVYIETETRENGSISIRVTDDPETAYLWTCCVLDNTKIYSVHPGTTWAFELSDLGRQNLAYEAGKAAACREAAELKGWDEV